MKSPRSPELAAGSNFGRAWRLARRVYIGLRAAPKTLLFNLRYLPFKQALSLPLLVSHRVKLEWLGGGIELTGPLRTGMIRLGFGYVDIFDPDRQRSVWSNRGRIAFRGRAYLGHGFRISVRAGGALTMGDCFSISAQSSILCRSNIEFGDDCLLAWDVLVMDSDWHALSYEGARRTGESVTIGDHVWIGCRSLILKGTSLGSGCVVAAGSTVAGLVSGPEALLAGVPARAVRNKVSWHA
jgi:acetyltransferase-like isoleucine patch superfamily enzyme